MKNNQINLIFVINVQDKKLIGFFIIICSTIFVQNIFIFKILSGELFEVDIFFDIVSLIEFYARIYLFCEFVHLIGLFVDDFVCM